MRPPRRQPKGRPAASSASDKPTTRDPRDGDRVVADGTVQPSLSPVAGLHPHPRSALVPAMTAEEYRTFVSDIAERGLRVPLDITAVGIVLDGHQRLRAARELSLPSVPVRIVSPEDEVEYMLLAAMRRRQLSPSQRAALAVE